MRINRAGMTLKIRNELRSESRKQTNDKSISIQNIKIANQIRRIKEYLRGDVQW